MDRSKAWSTGILLLAGLQPSGTSMPLASMAITSTARIVVAALPALSIRTDHHESPNFGVLTQEGKPFWLEPQHVCRGRGGVHPSALRGVCVLPLLFWAHGQQRHIARLA